MIFYLLTIILLESSYSSEIEFYDDSFMYMSDGLVISHESKKKSLPNFKTYHTNLTRFRNEFSPTVLTDRTQAHNYFQEMRVDYKKDAQCTSMAHVWAYEGYKSSSIKTEKIFIFFSKNYIKKYRFNWWFHVAPLVTISEDGKLNKIVLDRAYTTMPFEIKTWTDHFIKSKKRCKLIKRISEYFKNDSMNDCYLMITSMYVWQPRDIRLYEEKGKVKNYFFRSDLRRSYEEAFTE